jgi:hypothetical protein
LPGADRARHVFPTVHELAEQLHAHGLQLIATVEVAEQDRHRSAKAAAAWIRSMRNADTLVLAFTDDEIAAGLERLDSYHPTTHASGHGSVWPPFPPPAELAGPNYAHAR